MVLVLLRLKASSSSLQWVGLWLVSRSCLGGTGTFKEEVSRGQVQRQGRSGSLDFSSFPVSFSSRCVFVSSFRGVG